MTGVSSVLPGQVQERVGGLLVGGDALQTQAVGVQGSCAHAGLDDEGQGHPDPRRDQRGPQEVGDGDAPQFAQGAGVEAGGAGDEATDHQRQDDHLQHAQQHLSGEGEVDHLRLGESHAADHHPEPNAHQNARHGHDHQQVPLQKVPHLLPAAPLRALLHDSIGGAGAGHRVAVNLALFLHLCGSGVCGSLVPAPGSVG